MELAGDYIYLPFELSGAVNPDCGVAVTIVYRVLPLYGLGNGGVGAWLEGEDDEVFEDMLR